MPSINDIYGSSQTLKAEDLQQRSHKVVIHSHEIVEFKEAGGIKRKIVLHLRDKKKGLVLNKTNSRIIAKYYGDDFTKWGGKEIEIFPTETEFNGGLVPCIRVRVEAPSSVPGTDDDISW